MKIRPPPFKLLSFRAFALLRLNGFRTLELLLFCTILVLSKRLAIDLTEQNGIQETRPYPIGISSYFFKFCKTQKYAHALLRESYTILISLSRNQLLYICAGF